MARTYERTFTVLSLDDETSSTQSTSSRKQKQSNAASRLILVGRMLRFTTVLLILVVLLVLLPSEAYAFGAGSIPGYAFLHDRAFRHGGEHRNICIKLSETNCALCSIPFYR